jgi:ATP-dependent Clp protease ATP-binding subunit ClpC
MPKINVYLPDGLAEAVREAQLPVSAICQSALERAVRDVVSARASDAAFGSAERTPGVLARFTPRARDVLVRAEATAREEAQPKVDTEHVLLGILDEGSNLAIRVIESLDVDVDDLRAELVASMPAGGGTPAPEGEHIPFSPRAKRALEATTKEAMALGHNYIGCEHLLLGLLATEKGTASKVLRRMGLELRTTRRATVTALAGVVHAQAMANAPGATAPAEAPAEGPATGEVLAQILRRLDAIEDRLSA